MAYIPDEAIRRRNDVSSGAFALYVHLCMFRCRKRDDENYGLAFPNQLTLVKEMGMNRQHISELTTELVRKEWIRKQGWKLRLLLGFHQLDDSGADQRTYIEDKSRESTTIESDNESYAMTGGQSRVSETVRDSEVVVKRYQTRFSSSSDLTEFSDKSNCRKIRAELSGKSFELSEFPDAHVGNQLGTKKEPVTETRAYENSPDGDDLTDPAVRYWWQTCQQRQRDPAYPFKQRLPTVLTIGMASRIAGRVVDLDLWRETVDFWSGNDYQLQHVMTILDNYRKRLLEKSKQQGANDASRHDEAKRIREERRRAGSVDGHNRSRSEHLRTA